MHNIELSVIIVNFNGKHYLKGCLDSLEINLANVCYEIIVYDNHSHDGSTSYLEENYPHVVLIKGKENLGFGRANNEAVKVASGKHLLLLNNDTIVLDPLKPVLQYYSAHKEVGVVGINMLNKDREYLMAVGKFPRWSNMIRLKNMFQYGKEFKNGTFDRDCYEVDWLGGSFLLLHKDLFLEVGGFDPDYFMYVEDVDFSYKIMKAGYQRMFLSRYSYVHFVGFNKSRNKALIAGYRVFIKKHYVRWEKTINLTAIFVNSLIKKLKNLFY